LTSAIACSDQGVILVPDSYTISTCKGQHRAKPHSDRSAKVGQQWGRHVVIGIVSACSVLTREQINIIVLGEPMACPGCGYVPVWDSGGNLVCNCKIWTDPDPAQERRRSPDSAIERAKRNQIYQNDLRKFFKRGRC